MAGFNEIIIKGSTIILKCSLTTTDRTANFENIQLFSPDEAENFGNQMLGAALRAREVEKKEVEAAMAKKHAEREKQTKKTKSKKKTAAKSKKRNRKK